MCVWRTTPLIPPIWASSNVYITLANIYHITGVTSVEIGDVASTHWQRVHRLQPILAVYWVSQMAAGRLWQQRQRHSSQTLTSVTGR